MLYIGYKFDSSSASDKLRLDVKEIGTHIYPSLVIRRFLFTMIVGRESFKNNNRCPLGASLTS